MQMPRAGQQASGETKPGDWEVVEAERRGPDGCAIPERIQLSELREGHPEAALHLAR